jgi:multisubunit Na+/H+ antiporter MnhG subunit
MSSESEELGHGHSVASWTAVVIMLFGFAMGTVAFCFGVAWLVWVSVVIVIAGPIVGYILGRAGWGVGGTRSAVEAHE